MPNWLHSPVFGVAMQTAFFLVFACVGLSVPAEKRGEFGPLMRRAIPICVIVCFLAAAICAGRLVYVLLF